MKIEIIMGDITLEETDAIVNAANNHLWMGSGVAGAIKRAGGELIEQEALKLGPIEAGEAVATTGGRLRAKYVIHAAAMGQDLATSEDLVRKTTLSTLRVADDLKLGSISFPAIGTGVGGLGLESCALAMLEVASKYQARFLEKIRFVLFNETGKRIFQDVLERLAGLS